MIVKNDTPISEDPKQTIEDNAVSQENNIQVKDPQDPKDPKPAVNKDKVYSYLVSLYDNAGKRYNKNKLKSISSSSDLRYWIDFTHKKTGQKKLDDNGYKKLSLSWTDVKEVEKKNQNHTLQQSIPQNAVATTPTGSGSPSILESSPTTLVPQDPTNITQVPQPKVDEYYTEKIDERSSILPILKQLPRDFLKMGEADAEVKFNELLGDFGYSASESNVGTNALNITRPDGTQFEIELMSGVGNMIGEFFKGEEKTNQRVNIKHNKFVMDLSLGKSNLVGVISDYIDQSRFGVNDAMKRYAFQMNQPEQEDLNFLSKALTGQENSNIFKTAEGFNSNLFINSIKQLKSNLTPAYDDIVKKEKDYKDSVISSTLASTKTGNLRLPENPNDSLTEEELKRNIKIKSTLNKVDDILKKYEQSKRNTSKILGKSLKRSDELAKIDLSNEDQINGLISSGLDMLDMPLPSLLINDKQASFQDVYDLISRPKELGYIQRGEIRVSIDDTVDVGVFNDLVKKLKTTQERNTAFLDEGNPRLNSFFRGVADIPQGIYANTLDILNNFGVALADTFEGLGIPKEVAEYAIFNQTGVYLPGAKGTPGMITPRVSMPTKKEVEEAMKLLPEYNGSISDSRGVGEFLSYGMQGFTSSVPYIAAFMANPGLGLGVTFGSTYGGSIEEVREARQSAREAESAGVLLTERQKELLNMSSNRARRYALFKAGGETLITAAFTAKYFKQLRLANGIKGVSKTQESAQQLASAFADQNRKGLIAAFSRYTGLSPKVIASEVPEEQFIAYTGYITDVVFDLKEYDSETAMKLAADAGLNSLFSSSGMSMASKAISKNVNNIADEVINRKITLDGEISAVKNKLKSDMIVNQLEESGELPNTPKFKVALDMQRQADDAILSFEKRKQELVDQMTPSHKATFLQGIADLEALQGQINDSETQPELINSAQAQIEEMKFKLKRILASYPSELSYYFLSKNQQADLTEKALEQLSKEKEGETFSLTSEDSEVIKRAAEIYKKEVLENMRDTPDDIGVSGYFNEHISYDDLEIEVDENYDPADFNLDQEIILLNKPDAIETLLEGDSPDVQDLEKAREKELQSLNDLKIQDLKTKTSEKFGSLEESKSKLLEEYKDNPGVTSKEGSDVVAFMINNLYDVNPGSNPYVDIKEWSDSEISELNLKNNKLIEAIKYNFPNLTKKQLTDILGSVNERIFLEHKGALLAESEGSSGLPNNMAELQAEKINEKYDKLIKDATKKGAESKEIKSGEQIFQEEEDSVRQFANIDRIKQLNLSQNFYESLDANGQKIIKKFFTDIKNGFRPKFARVETLLDAQETVNELKVLNTTKIDILDNPKLLSKKNINPFSLIQDIFPYVNNFGRKMMMGRTKVMPKNLMTSDIFLGAIFRDTSKGKPFIDLVSAANRNVASAMNTSAEFVNQDVSLFKNEIKAYNKANPKNKISTDLRNLELSYEMQVLAHLRRKSGEIDQSTGLDTEFQRQKNSLLKELDLRKQEYEDDPDNITEAKYKQLKATIEGLGLQGALSYKDVSRNAKTPIVNALNRLSERFPHQEAKQRKKDYEGKDTFFVDGTYVPSFRTADSGQETSDSFRLKNKKGSDFGTFAGVLQDVTEDDTLENSRLSFGNYFERAYQQMQGSFIDMNSRQDFETIDMIVNSDGFKDLFKKEGKDYKSVKKYFGSRMEIFNYMISQGQNVQMDFGSPDLKSTGGKIGQAFYSTLSAIGLSRFNQPASQFYSATTGTMPMLNDAKARNHLKLANARFLYSMAGVGSGQKTAKYAQWANNLVKGGQLSNIYSQSRTGLRNALKAEFAIGENTKLPFDYYLSKFNMDSSLFSDEIRGLQYTIDGVLEVITKTSEGSLEFFLANADRAAANSAFEAHYLQNRIDQGAIVPKDISAWWKKENENPNTEAIEYADRRIAETMRQTEPTSEAEFYAINAKTGTKAAQRMIFPWGKFMLNAKANFANQYARSQDKNVPELQRQEARKRMRGILNEVAVFNGIKLSTGRVTTIGFVGAAMMQFGADEDDIDRYGGMTKLIGDAFLSIEDPDYKEQLSKIPRGQRETLEGFKASFNETATGIDYTLLELYKTTMEYENKYKISPNYSVLLQMATDMFKTTLPYAVPDPLYDLGFSVMNELLGEEVIPEYISSDLDKMGTSTDEIVLLLKENLGMYSVGLEQLDKFSKAYTLYKDRVFKKPGSGVSSTGIIEYIAADTPAMQEKIDKVIDYLLYARTANLLLPIPKGDVNNLLNKLERQIEENYTRSSPSIKGVNNAFFKAYLDYRTKEQKQPVDMNNIGEWWEKEQKDMDRSAKKHALDVIENIRKNVNTPKD